MTATVTTSMSQGMNNPARMAATGLNRPTEIRNATLCSTHLCLGPELRNIAGSANT